MIWITGATGFVGLHLTSYLSSKRIAWRPIDLRDGHWRDQVVLGEGDAVIHLAGKAHDHKGIATEEEFFQVNVDLTKSVFTHFLQSKASSFLAISSIAAVSEFGSAEVLTEQSEPHPSSAYGRSKRAAEIYLEEHIATAPQKKIFILRPSMIHGPGDKGNLTLLYNIVAKGIPFPLGAFRNERSFLSVDNLSFLLERIVVHAANMPSGIYHLADDQAIATNEIVRLIGEVNKKKVKIWLVPKFFIRALAALGNILPLPLNTRRLNKMTGNLRLSNQKIKDALKLESLPVDAWSGLRKTIQSFSKK